VCGYPDTGDGNDTITGAGTTFGIYNQAPSLLEMRRLIIADGGFEVGSLMKVASWL